MAIADAACLGQALREHPDNIAAALECYNKARIPATRQEVGLTSKFARSAACTAAYAYLSCQVSEANAKLLSHLCVHNRPV